jgi:hypothetical protein
MFVAVYVVHEVWYCWSDSWDCVIETASPYWASWCLHRLWLYFGAFPHIGTDWRLHPLRGRWLSSEMFKQVSGALFESPSMRWASLIPWIVLPYRWLSCNCVQPDTVGLTLQPSLGPAHLNHHNSPSTPCCPLVWGYCISSIPPLSWGLAPVWDYHIQLSSAVYLD